ncbi:MAG: hypothetical protein AB1664_22685, partial [Thermodesulfobacteriota bacterium]
VKSLDEIAHFLNGLALQKYPPGDGPTLPVIKIAQLRKGDAGGADQCNTGVPADYIVGDGDVLFSWSGSLECVLWTGGKGALNQHLFKVTSQEYPKWFYYFWIHEHLPAFRYIAAGKATTMGHIQRHHLTDAKVVVPNADAMTAANRVIAPLVERILGLRIESRTLAALRDALLPKLMSRRTAGEGEGSSGGDVMKHLRNLGNRFEIPLPVDEDGYLGRECPNVDCTGYFKIVPGTGLRGITECHCPYCGHTADQSEFATQDQVEYAKSVAIRKITEAFIEDFKSLEFDIKPKGSFGIGLSLKVKPGRPHPIHWYREKALETHIECSNCTLKYAVFGVFAFCPDCGQHNSLQILRKNLELVAKMLDMACSADAELAERLVENALEDCISAFDGFAREICRVRGKASTDPDMAEKVSFQNLGRGKQNVSTLFGLDLAAGLTDDEWRTAVRAFQKRHLLAHKMGVVDEEYVRKSGDADAVVGRKIKIGANEVRELVQILGKLAQHFVDGLQRLGKEP